MTMTYIFVIMVELLAICVKIITENVPHIQENAYKVDMYQPQFNIPKLVSCLDKYLHVELVTFTLSMALVEKTVKGITNSKKNDRV